MLNCPKCHAPISFWKFLNYADQKPYKCECGSSLNMSGMFYAFLWTGILALPLKVFFTVGPQPYTGLIGFVFYCLILNWVIPKAVKITLLVKPGHDN